MKMIQKIAGWWGYEKKAALNERWLPILSALSQANVKITPDTALRVSAVMACVKVLAEGVASLPLDVYQRIEGGKSKYYDHPLYRILHTQPNSFQTSFEFREMMQGHLALRGNAYAEKIFDRMGNLLMLWPFHPDRVEIERLESGNLRYTIKDNYGRKLKALLQDEILHVKGLSSDGVVGLSPIRTAAESIGLSIAAESLGASFFKNGAVMGNVLQHPGKLTDKARANLEKSMKEEYAGSNKAYQTLILEEGMKWDRLGIPPEEAQFLETRKFQVTDVARIYRVPPHMIGDLEKATFSNIEHQGIEFVIHTLRPWLVRWEMAMGISLMDEEEYPSQVFPEFNVDGLLRGDAKTRAESLERQFRNGVITIDEWREIENKNHLPGGVGKQHYILKQLVPIDEAGDDVNNNSVPFGALDGAMEAWIDDASSRMANAEYREIEKHIGWAKTHRKRFNSWLEHFYVRHQDYMHKLLMPLQSAYNQVIEDIVAEVTVLEFIDTFTKHHLNTIVESESPVEVVGKLASKQIYKDNISMLFDLKGKELKNAL